MEAGEQKFTLKYSKRPRMTKATTGQAACCPRALCCWRGVNREGGHHGAGRRTHAGSAAWGLGTGEAWERCLWASGRVDSSPS